METSKSSPQAPGLPEATEGQTPFTPNQKVKIRLNISPSPAQSTASSPPIHTPLVAEASASEVPTAENSIEETTTGETSTAAEESQGKDPATKKKAKPKKSSKKKKSFTASASNSTPSNKAAAEPTNPTTPPRQIPAPEKASSAPATISTPPAKRPGAPTTPSTPTKKASVEPTKPSTQSNNPAPKATSHRPPKFSGPSNKAAPDSSSSIPDLFPRPRIHSRNSKTEPAMGSGKIEIPEFQIMCCNGGVYANSGLHNQSHRDLKDFIKKFAGTDALPVHHPKGNAYGVIWTEYRYVIGIMEFDPNEVTWKVYFYGCDDLTKGKVVELLPPVRPMICTTVDAAKRNEECLVRVDCGVDFQCKTHGDWRWTAYFVTWQAPGELNRRNKEAKKLAKKEKKKHGGSSSGFEAHMGGLGDDTGGGAGSMTAASQMDGADEAFEQGSYFDF